MLANRCLLSTRDFDFLFLFHYDFNIEVFFSFVPTILFSFLFHSFSNGTHLNTDVIRTFVHISFSRGMVA